MKPIPRTSSGRLLTPDIYKHPLWYKLRGSHLKYNPYCVYCAEVGECVEGNYVDHIKSHNGLDALFFDRNNLQTLCAPHHNSTKHREEIRGHELGCDLNGWPRGVEHYWNNGDPNHKPFDLDIARGARKRISGGGTK